MTREPFDLDKDLSTHEDPTVRDLWFAGKVFVVCMFLIGAMFMVSMIILAVRGENKTTREQVEKP